ncbi:MAG: hypothetical protein IJM59_00960 [Proteobacteria bacterium]|nr:hypothetical protein [Pseudomonadota bacterium]
MKLNLNRTFQTLLISLFLFAVPGLAIAQEAEGQAAPVEPAAPQAENTVVEAAAPQTENAAAAAAPQTENAAAAAAPQTENSAAVAAPQTEADNQGAVSAQPEYVQEEIQSDNKVYTAKDNFGGWKFGADIMFGAGRCDEKTCLGQPDEQDFDEKMTGFVAKLQLQLSYLWGKNVFFGPVLTAFGGYPALVGGDLRLRLVIPLGKGKRDAVSASAGWGGQLRFKMVNEWITYANPYDKPDVSYIKTGEPHDLFKYSYMYVPLEMRYEHVFDNRFVLGVVVQYNITFNYRAYSEAIEGKDLGFKYISVLDMIGGGIHLGYKF